MATADVPADPALTRALARLRSDASPAREALVTLLVDTALAQPLAAIAPPDRVVALVCAVAGDEARVERALLELGRPALARQQRALEGRGEPVRAWLPPDAEQALDAIFADTRLTSGVSAARWIDPAHVRELLAPLLQETLLAFARKLPLVGGAEEHGATKLLGGLARGLAQGAGERAQRLADLGRGVLGGLGSEMERRVTGAAREFSQGAFEPLRESFERRLASDEGRAILARMRAHAVRTALDLPAAELAAWIDAAPRAPVERLLARTLAHDLARPEVREALAGEVAALAAHAGDGSVGAALEGWGVLTPVREELLAQAEALVRAVVGGDAFGAWLAALLSASDAPPT